MLEQQESVEPTASPEEAEAIATLAYGYGYLIVPAWTSAARS